VDISSANRMALEEYHAYRKLAPVGIGNREAQTAPAHPLVLSTGKGPFKAKFLQFAYQFTS
jgi:hypothetical protein